MDEGAQHPRIVVIGRGIPTLPGLLVVALVAGFAGLLAGWQLAGGDTQRPSTVSEAPTIPPSTRPLVVESAVDEGLRRAYVAMGRPGGWLVCRRAGSLDCRTVEPLQLAPDAAAEASGGLWSLLAPVELASGGRLALVADLSHAVGAIFSLATETGDQPDTAEVTEDGVHYVDLGALPPGRYLVVTWEELGPPAGGLVGAIRLDIVGA